VSEWFLLEALMQQFRVPGLEYRLVLALAGAAVALTAGFAGVTFVRLIGLVVLGPPLPRPAGQRQERDYGLAGRVALAGLAAGCLAVAALTPLEIRVIGAGLSPIVPAAVVTEALKSPWVLQPVFAGFSIVSPSWLWIVMPALLLAVVAFSLAVSGSRMIQVRRVPAWKSATAGVAGADSYTAFGFANPTRRVLAAVLHTRAGVEQIGSGTVLTGSGAGQASPADATADADGRADAHAGADARSRTAAADGQVPHVGYTSDVIEVVEQYVYRPVLRPVMALVRTAKRLQSGRLDAYLAYMLIALVALLALVAALN
jgi:hypothetical protein